MVVDKEIPEGFQKTDIGIIPNDWEVFRIGDDLRFKNGLNKEKKFFGQGTPIVNYMDVYKNRGLRAKDLKGKVTLSDQEIKNYEVRKGDVFFTRTSETIEEIGIASVVLEDLFNTSFSGFILRARPINSKLENEFCQYCFSTAAVRKQILTTASYTTRALTNGRLLSEVKIPLPPTKAEQTTIATALNDADKLITELEKLIAKKKMIKQGAMQELLRPKEGWVSKYLGEECELITKGTTPTSIGREFQNNGINFIKIESLTVTGRIIKDKVAFIDGYTNNLLKRSQLKSNDILFSIAGALGRVAIVSDEILPANTNQALSIIRLKKETNLYLKYLFYYLNSNRIQTLILAINVQGAQANLSLQNISELPIDFPDITEQSQIAKILLDMDSEIESLEKKLAKYKMIKQGMMQNLLTGKIRLV